jgi:hypothetical protein
MQYDTYAAQVVGMCGIISKVCLSLDPRWSSTGDLWKPSLVMHRPLETCVELGLVSSLRPLVHLVLLLMGGMNRAKRREFAGFVSPFHPRLPFESTGHPPLCAP